MRSLRRAFQVTGDLVTSALRSQNAPQIEKLLICPEGEAGGIRFGIAERTWFVTFPGEVRPQLFSFGALAVGSLHSPQRAKSRTSDFSVCCPGLGLLAGS